MGSQSPEDDALEGRKRVVLFESDSLLAASLASLLRTLPALEVIHVAIATLEGVDALAQMRPDVVILEDTLLQRHLSEMLQLTERCPRLRAVVLNTGHNCIQVFDKQIVAIEQIGDFLDLLSG